MFISNLELFIHFLREPEWEVGQRDKADSPLILLHQSESQQERDASSKLQFSRWREHSEQTLYKDMGKMENNEQGWCSTSGIVTVGSYHHPKHEGPRWERGIKNADR